MNETPTPTQAEAEARATERRLAAAERERRMYGCIEAELRAAVEEHRATTGPSMMAMSWASDAQACIALADDATSATTRSAALEEARQLLNRVKWVVWHELRSAVDGGAS